jgi:hypothetical protein
MSYVREFAKGEKQMTERQMEDRARRAAAKAGLVARKSRWRCDSIDNHGGFMLIEPSRNICVNGSRYELSAEAVIDLCRAYEEAKP